MGTFKTLTGSDEEIDKELNLLAETNHVKIVSSNAVVITKNLGKKENEYKELINILVNEIVSKVHIYFTPKQIKNEDKNISI